MNEGNTPDADDLISVVIPAFNAEAFIHKAIDSVLTQYYSHFELIVVNDGSTDNTEKIIQNYSDTRIRLISQRNGGLSHARNTGIQSSQGNYIAFLDADDYWLPEKLSQQIDFLQKNPDIGFCSTNTRVETPDGQFLNDWQCPVIEYSTLHTLFKQNASVAGSGSSVMVRKELQIKAGGFDETLKSLEDIDMWMRYAALSEYRCIPDTLTVITKRPDSMSRNLTTMRENAIKVMKKNRGLLDKKSQGSLWRSSFAGMLCDFAKWEARCGLKVQAILHLIIAFFYAPLTKGRLSLGLMVGVLTDSIN
ncbi:glycosyltransferase family 2 protein [Methylotuvimicrobium buryatense]|uniref:Glycosyltransferase family 2 protein n=1 Tax=Methylotuvimicrobium buryatense TaxID=95641 RepID=A0A4P9ULC2_METBY|nr:glycosyltransferase family A protein [Methylotuvimicrobium buryatense]QCW81988.1 glycosyltransferase family 2 protein [Methylotuvimicrobium buryatense]